MVRNGPAGCNAHLDWNIRHGYFDFDDCFTFFEYKRLGSVSEDTIIYRFSSTFLAEADEYYLLKQSSKDRRIHIFQKVGVASGNDSIKVYPTETICFRSDQNWEP